MDNESLSESLIIKNERLKTCISSIKIASERLWNRQFVQHYTDHGSRHSNTIIQKVGDLLELSPEYSDLLNKYERFILLASIYLHDIGMQSPTHAGLPRKEYRDYDKSELEELRRNHHIASAKMIKESINGKLGFSLGLEQCKREGNFIATISKYHRNLDIKKLDDTSFAGKNLRLPLLAALLRLGDELDADFQRVNLNRLKIWELPMESKFHWWRHRYVQSISIDRGRIRIDLAFPRIYQQNDIKEAFKNYIYSSITKTFDEVYDILYDSGVRLHRRISISGENEKMAGLEPVPSNLRTYIKEQVIKSMEIMGEVDVSFSNR